MNVLSITTSTSSISYQRELKALEKKGINIKTITPRKQHRKFENSSEQRTVLDYLHLFPKVIQNQTKQFDLVYVNFGLVAPFAVAQLHRPIVLKLKGSDLFGKYGFVSKSCAPLFDEVIVRSQRMADELPCNAHIVPSGVNLDQFKPMSKSKARDHMRWDNDKLHVLFPYDPERDVKNHPLAKDIVDAVDSRLATPVVLQTVYGISHEEMVYAINSSDALLLTSKREGSPNTVKEAMACNVPIVATDVGDVSDRISNVDMSGTFKSKSEMVDFLERILKNPGETNGREKIKKLDIENTADSLNTIFEKAIGKFDE